MKLALVAFAAASLIGMNTLAAPLQTPSFAPENDLYIGVDEKSASTIDKTSFYNIVNRAEEIYGPIVKSHGGHLVMFNNWEDGKVNAYTRRSGNDWEVHMFGGLARFTNMTPDAFAMVVCHELGHQLGGLPKKTNWFGMTSWASAEGQSDYFASAKCMKHYLAEEDNQEYIKNLVIPKVATEKCSNVYSDLEERAICLRIAVAGEALGNVLNEMRGNTNHISLETPDASEVNTTNVAGYPGTQCRADTYFQGALCDADPNVEPNSTDIHAGYCARENGYEDGARPLCWFNPEVPNGSVDPYYLD